MDDSRAEDINETPGIKFFNIRSGEIRVANTEPMISAFLNSSDRHPNALGGQDMGWRLAAETLVQIEKIQKNPEDLRTISLTYQIPLENVTEADVLRYISDHQEETGGAGLDQSAEDFQKQYEKDIERERARMQASTTPKPEETGEDTDSEDEDEDEAEAEETPVEEEAEEETPKESVETVALEDMTRPELEKVAAAEKIDNPSEFANKGKLIEAIKDKQKES